MLSIGDVADRTGVAVSALCYYEEKGLIAPLRNRGGQRRYERADIRRVSFILIAQQMGLSIAEIANQLSQLPNGRTPNAGDWTRISRAIATRLDDRIRILERTRELLDQCIGCGCLSLAKCKLYNVDDMAARDGAGPRYLIRSRADIVGQG